AIWAGGALGVVALLLPLPWLSSGARGPGVASTTGPSSAPTTAPAPPVAGYSVASRAEPSNAEIWLDGLRLGRGEFDTVLPKDGRPHQLRVVADGYLPATV